MIYFLSDYSQGAHLKVMEALNKTNSEHTAGYGIDPHCERAAALIREMTGLGADCGVHFMTGGTSCNMTVIAAALRPYESVIAARTAHIYVHETGAVEGTGHRVTAVPGIDGKLTPELIMQAFREGEDEHTAMPRMVYLSQPTESGTLYSKSEMQTIAALCRELGLYLYVDGARLGSALCSAENDLTIRDLARLCDAFYIGGTKNGALFGEALVIRDPKLNDHFRWMIKHQGGMLAKGRLIGVQFEALLEPQGDPAANVSGGDVSRGTGAGHDSKDEYKCLYFDIARRENYLADRLRTGLRELGCRFYCETSTNQVFPLLPVRLVEQLEENFIFHRWAPEQDGLIPVRLVTGWGTTEEEVDILLDCVRKSI
jgi:threonine aldolase